MAERLTVLKYKRAIFAECKWTNENVDIGVLETMPHTAQVIILNKIQGEKE